MWPVPPANLFLSWLQHFLEGSGGRRENNEFNMEYKSQVCSLQTFQHAARSILPFGILHGLGLRKKIKGICITNQVSHSGIIPLVTQTAIYTTISLGCWTFFNDILVYEPESEVSPWWPWVVSDLSAAALTYKSVMWNMKGQKLFCLCGGNLFWTAVVWWIFFVLLYFCFHLFFLHLVVPVQVFIVKNKWCVSTRVETLHK